MNEPIFFWNGPFSQWRPCFFTIDSIEYNCAEQYMMAQKALIFKDMESYHKIMATDSPREQKAIGRLVKNFDIPEWNKHCRDIVYRGNMAKFTQNKGLLEILMNTGDAEIVEASPYDPVWGIGLSEDDERIHDKSQWKGTNWLGEAIMQVRETIKALKEIEEELQGNTNESNDKI